MNLHGQINDACESRYGHPQPCHWSVWIVLECGFHVKLKMDFSSCGLCRVLANPVTYNVVLYLYTKQKHLEHKKCKANYRNTGRCDQKL